MRYALFLAPLVLAACESPSLQGMFTPAPVAPAPEAPPAPDAAPLAPPPRPTARRVEEFDTTTAADRAAALQIEPAAQERLLGTTIASLGDPTDPGIWLKTPYVSTAREGRVEVSATGKTATMQLRPSGGAPGSGSQISLPAMRLLGVPLTDLPELKVYAR